MSRPLISVVMAVRNGEKYVAEALDSIVRQDMPAVETVVVDNSSGEGPARISAEHPVRPVLIRQEPEGVGAALNAGVRRASGTLIAFLDHDDVWPAGRLRSMLTALEANPECDGVFGKIVNTDEALNPLSAPQPARLITAMLIKKQAFQRVGQFRTDVAHGANIDWISRAGQADVRLGDRGRIQGVHDDAGAGQGFEPGAAGGVVPVAVGVDDGLDDKSFFFRLRHDPFDIRTGVDHHGLAGLLATDQVAEVVHVTDLELPDDHQVFSLLTAFNRITYGVAPKESTTCHLKGVKT